MQGALLYTIFFYQFIIHLLFKIMIYLQFSESLKSYHNYNCGCIGNIYLQFYFFCIYSNHNPTMTITVIHWESGQDEEKPSLFRSLSQIQNYI